MCAFVSVGSSKTDVGNGVLTATGKAILEPVPKRALSELDKRVEYVPFNPEPVFKETFRDRLPLSDERAKDLLRPSADPLGREILDVCGIPKGATSVATKSLGALMFAVGNMEKTAVARIKEEFHDRLPVAVRGVACSLGTADNVDTGSHKFRVKTVAEILSSGTEKLDMSKNPIMTTPIGSESTGFEQYTRAYLITSVQESRERLKENPDAAKQVFPALLVYDKKMLDALQSGGLATPENLSVALLKVYIFDYPHKTLDSVL